MRYFVIGPDGSEFGPADVALLNEWIAQKRLEPETILRMDGTQDVVKAHCVSGLNFIPEAPSAASEPPASAPQPQGFGDSAPPQPSGSFLQHSPPPSGFPMTPMIPNPPSVGGSDPYVPTTPRTPQYVPRTSRGLPPKMGVGIAIAIVVILVKMLPAILIFSCGRHPY